MGSEQEKGYESRTGQSEIPVLKDDAPIETTEYSDREIADSDKQLERDEQDAIDESNILNERTRGASKKSGTYTEPGDDEGLERAVEGNDGTSSGRQ
ncbi:uncharacterized protein M421DRAFT_416203 [Didymella exigua CBS 183.55]|uniref:Histone chaperone domain-containing protein n=1 Tax=Didymella exigua CBS 183.55 TaxID=1150837 RepID=A0A6A5RYH6_9PLEO|nr:uncharacterized protein M421DRAFT_416203 [Didymella exigua CBS 183.55]KAF1932579.1 hypothetical protein M421DRAFT_416203 [Didymella exigua CBS 183.55]